MKRRTAIIRREIPLYIEHVYTKGLWHIKSFSYEKPKKKDTKYHKWIRVVTRISDRQLAKLSSVYPKTGKITWKEKQKK